MAYVNEPCDMYEAISNGLDKEDVDDRSAYYTIDEAPPIMHFVVPRVIYEDRVEVRNTKQLKLDPHIFLDRFMRDDTMLRKRQLFWTYREKLRERRVRREKLIPADQDIGVAETLNRVSDYLKGLREHEEELEIGLPLDDEKLHQSLHEEADNVDAEVRKLDDDIYELKDRMHDLFPDSGRLKYSLQAVFVHRGSTRSGHWFTYMYDARGDKWRKYNDEDVEVLDQSRLQTEIFTPDEAFRGATVVVVYALEDRSNELFEPVCRKPDSEPEPPAQWQQPPVRSQQSEMPPANTPYEGASKSEERLPWDTERDVADSNVLW